MSNSVCRAIQTLALLMSLARYARRTTATAALSVGLWLLALAGAAGAEAPIEGFGTTTPGGSGRPEYVVTNLNDSGPGSLRDAVSSGNRMVRFAVGGQINVTTGPIHVRGQFITIDGFTAPEPGITLDGAGLVLRGDLGAHDVIIRGLRIRNIRNVGDTEMDGIQIRTGASRVVISHMSIWAGPAQDSGDGLIDITEGARDVTVAWSILAGSGKAMLIKYRRSPTDASQTKRVSLHHNLWVGGRNRNPQVSVDDEGTPADEITVDMWNNVIYDWDRGAGTAIHHGARANALNNVYSSPHDPLSDQEQALIVCQSGVCFSHAGLDPRANARAYTSGNVSGDPLSFDINSVGTENAPFPVGYSRTLDPACHAAKEVLRNAGPSGFQRDGIDLQFLTPIDLAVCRGTTTALTTAASPTLLGESVTFTARVASEPPAGGPPGGSVTFFRGSVPMGTVPLVEGVVDSVATFTTNDLLPGTFTAKAVYSGEPEEFDESQASLKHQVIGVLTETELLPVSPSYVGHPVTLTAQVTAQAPSTATPEGSVRFYDGSKILATKPLESGRASLVTSALPAGFRRVKAQFLGGSGFGASSSPTQSVRVDGGTVTSLARKPTSARPGQSVTFTAHVEALTAGGPPPGTVTFRDGTTLLGTLPLDGGTAVLTTSNLAIGKHPVTASYNGISSSFEPSVSPVASVSIVQGGTKTVLTSTTQGRFVTFTAVVTPVSPAAGIPNGTVTFKDGAVILGTVDLSGGRAVKTVELGPGSHTISAAYSGSEEFKSNKVTVKINQ
jgi:pectate lyase